MRPCVQVATPLTVDYSDYVALHVCVVRVVSLYVGFD